MPQYRLNISVAIDADTKEDAERFATLGLDSTGSVYGDVDFHNTKLDEEIPHGTRNGYNYHRCRCSKCRYANAVYHRLREWRERDERLDRG